MPDAICYIVGAGENTGLDFTPGKKDYVIAADGGLKHLAAAGIGADLVIGDFDTLGGRPDHPHTVALPPEKDETDTYAALREGMRLGYGVFYIYGGTGGRLEHTLANIQLLAYLAEKNMRGFLFGSGVVLAAVKDGAITFGAGAEGSVSVFSLTEKSCGVYLRSLKYPLADATLTHTFPLGVSNAFTGARSAIEVREGTLLAVFPRAVLPYILQD